jgi:hypothetical protein
MRSRALTPIALVAAFAGCGGDDGDRPAERSRPAAPVQAPRTVPVVAAEDAPAIDVARERRLAARQALRRARREHERELRALARRVAAQVAEAAGVTEVAVAGGERLRVRGEAECDVGEAAVRRRIRQALPEDVRVDRVSLRRDCALEPPTGRGRLLLELEGDGAAATGAVRAGPRWVVEYAARGRFLQVLVERDGRLVAPPIRATAELVGRRVFRGRGRVRLHVAGDDRWLVRIRRLSGSTGG